MCPMLLPAVGAALGSASGLATFAVGALETVSGFMAQKQEAKATQEAADVAYQNDVRQTNLRQMQEADATSQKLQAENLEEAEAKADLSVNAAQAGVGGISIDSLLADVSRRSARNRETHRENLRMVTTQLQEQKRGAAATKQSRINSAPKPSGLSLVAGLAGAGLSGYNRSNKFIPEAA